MNRNKRTNLHPPPLGFVWQVSGGSRHQPSWGSSQHDSVSPLCEGRGRDLAVANCSSSHKLASFPGSPEREMYTRGEPGFSRDHDVIKIGPEFLELKGNVLRIIQPALRSTLSVYDIRPPIAIYV